MAITYDKDKGGISNTFLDLNNEIYQRFSLRNNEEMVQQLPYLLLIRHPKSFEVKFERDTENDFLREKSQFFTFNLSGDVALINRNFQEENFKVNFINEELKQEIVKDQISLLSLICNEATRNCFALMKSEGEEQTPLLMKTNFETGSNNLCYLRRLIKNSK